MVIPKNFAGHLSEEVVDVLFGRETADIDTNQFAFVFCDGLVLGIDVEGDEAKFALLFDHLFDLAEFFPKRRLLNLNNNLRSPLIESTRIDRTTNNHLLIWLLLILLDN